MRPLTIKLGVLASVLALSLTPGLAHAGQSGRSVAGGAESAAYQKMELVAQANDGPSPTRPVPGSQAATTQQSPAHGLDPDLKLVDLATRGAEGWLRYRIPALALLTNGELLAVYDGRPTMADLPSRITLLMRRSSDGGETWQPQEIIRQEEAPKGFGDPSLLVNRRTGDVFVFYAASINRGYGNSSTSSDPNDPDVLHLDYSVSRDQGVTWEHKRITQQIKGGHGDWGGMFAASGQGIQLQYGEHAGRMLQQYTLRKNGQNYALTVYSDDDGQTWQAGTPVGPGADENKTVELSDGRIMLNSRSAPARLVAYSSDQGHSYTQFVRDEQLPDPSNNGSVIRAFPDAPADSPAAKILLFSNSANSRVRRNLTVRMSCDDGQTWPVARVVQSGASAYSTLVALPGADGKRGGRYGLFYERDGYRHLSYTSFDLQWLGGVCASLSSEQGKQANTGEQVAVPVTVTNQSDTTLAPGSLTVATAGWHAAPVSVPELAVGASHTADVVIEVPATAAPRTHQLQLEYTNPGGKSGGVAAVQVEGAPSQNQPGLVIEPVIDAIYANEPAGLLGDRIQPWVEFHNTGNVPLRNIRLTEPAGGDCGLPILQPGQSGVCRNNSPRHIVGDADLTAGQWTAHFVATAEAGEDSVTAEADLFPVELKDIVATNEAAAVWLPTENFASSSFVRVPRVSGVGPLLTQDATLELTVPANSRQSAQVAVTAAKPVAALTASVSELTGPGQAQLSGAVQVRYATYVPDTNFGGLVADPLVEAESVEIAAGHNQPIWLTVQIPADAVPGQYNGTLEVQADGQRLGAWPLRVTVPQSRFRPVAERPFTLDMWQHPDAVADARQLTPWSEEHFVALRPYWEEMAEAGQDVLNLAIVEDPWLVDHEGEIRAQTASPYRSTIKWIYDGQRWEFNYDVFDRLVADARAAGIGKRIHAFAPLQFQSRDRLFYYDKLTGEARNVPMRITDPGYQEAWRAFLVDFKMHLEVKGWFSDTSLAFDEQPLARMNTAFGFIREADPAWSDKIALAANTLAEADIATYISFNYTFLNQVPRDLIERRRAAGKPTLFYTWNEPTVPNTVVRTPPFNARMIGWVVEGADLDGYLRWTFNSWPSDVYNSPKFRYGQGDEYIIYPGAAGPISSIRWETFKDGLEDAELLDLAKERLGRDAGVVRSALDSVSPEAPAQAENFTELLNHRAVLLEALSDEDLTAISVVEPIALPEVSTLDPAGELVARVKVRNNSDVQRSVSLAVAPGDLVNGEPVVAAIDPGQSQELLLPLTSKAGPGAQTVQLTLTTAGKLLARADYDVVFGGYFLSDVEWEGTPINGWGPVERDTANGEDQANDGGPIMLAGRRFHKGLGAHANSRITYQLSPQCTAVHFTYGIDDAVRRPGSRASVYFEVRGDGQRLWRSSLASATTAPAYQSVDVTGMGRLELVLDADGHPGQDHGDWAGIWAECPLSMPSPSPTQTQTATPTPTASPAPRPTPTASASPTVAPPQPQVERIAGANRVETALAAARRGNFSSRVAVLADGKGFADSVSAVALASAHNAPLLLTTANRLEPSVVAYLREHSIAKVFVVGGPGSVSDEKLGELRGAGSEVTRVAGRSRFATAAEILRHLPGAALPPKRIFVADGGQFSDALVAASAAGATGGVVVFTFGEQVPTATATVLATYPQASVVAVGGGATRALRRDGYLPGVTMTVAAGANRYATAATLSELVPHGENVVVASGEDFADALPGAVLAGNQQSIMLLSASTRLPAATQAVLAGKPGWQQILLLGGLSTLHLAVEQGLSDYLRH